MASPPMGRADRVNILVVDDRPSKLIAMEALLADLGENVVCVGSGADALRQLLEREFALILLDVNMPDMDGFEAAALIRQRPRLQHIPIIFMTAGSDDHHALQGYSLGAVDYILTPVVPEVLRTKVKVFVDLFKMTEQLKRQAEERVALAEEQARRAAAEAANLRAVFLGDAGKSMTRSLDLETTANTILGLMVPDFGDFAMLRLSAVDGDTVHVRHGDASPGTAEGGRSGRSPARRHPAAAGESDASGRRPARRQPDHHREDQPQPVDRQPGRERRSLLEDAGGGGADGRARDQRAERGGLGGGGFGADRSDPHQPRRECPQVHSGRREHRYPGTPRGRR